MATISTNMLLPIPDVGVTEGPQYATDVDNCLTIIDSHTHSAGSGVQITPDGLNINSDLSMQNNNLTLTNSVRFTTNASALVGGTDLRCIYSVGNELYYNDGLGNNVAITNGGSVAGSTGNITNLVAPASVVFSNISNTYTFEYDTGLAASLDAANLVMRNNSLSSYGLTLQPPSAMSADYVLTLPSQPISKKIVTITSAGAINADYDVDNSTIEVSSLNLQVKDSGITTAKLLNSAVTTAKIADLNVTDAKLAADSVITSKILDANVTTAKLATGGVTTAKIANYSVTPFKQTTNSAGLVAVSTGSFSASSTMATLNFNTTDLSSRAVLITFQPIGVIGGATPFLGNFDLYINGVLQISQPVDLATGKYLSLPLLQCYAFQSGGVTTTWTITAEISSGSTGSVTITGSGFLRAIEI